MQRSMCLSRLSVAVALILLCCMIMTSCGTYLPDYVSFWREISPEGTIVWDDNYNITYNGTKYVSIENYNVKIRTDYDSEDCEKIATMPYSYLLGAVSVFYADDFQDPDIISCNRGDDVWVREGMDIDRLIMETRCVVSDTISFRICDVITDEVIPYSSELGLRRSPTRFDRFPLEAYPAFSFHVTIVQIDGELYLQYVWNSDFYRITDDFAEALYTNGLIKS